MLIQLLKSRLRNREQAETAGNQAPEELQNVSGKRPRAEADVEMVTFKRHRPDVDVKIESDQADSTKVHADSIQNIHSWRR